MSFQNMLSLNTSGHHCLAEAGHLLQQLASLSNLQQEQQLALMLIVAPQAAGLDNIMLEVEAITLLAVCKLCLLQNWLLVGRHS